MKLPYEDAGRAQVLVRFRDQLTEMGQLLTLAFTVVPHGGFTVTRTRGLDQAAVHVAAGLFIKACKTYRSLILLGPSALVKSGPGLLLRSDPA